MIDGIDQGLRREGRNNYNRLPQVPGKLIGIVTLYNTIRLTPLQVSFVEANEWNLYILLHTSHHLHRDGPCMKLET